VKTSETLLESLEDQLMEARSQVPAGILEDELTSQEILEKRLIDQSKGQGLRQLKGIMVRRTRGELALLVDTWRSTLNIENAAKQARTEAREQRSFHLGFGLGLWLGHQRLSQHKRLLLCYHLDFGLFHKVRSGTTKEAARNRKGGQKKRFKKMQNLRS